MVDTLGDFVVAINLMPGEIRPPGFAGQALDASAVGRLVGKGSEHLVKSVLFEAFSQSGRTPLATDSIAIYAPAFASYQKHYAAVNGHYSALYPGVLQGLNRLKKSGLKLACLTNKPLGFALSLLELKGLNGFFGTVFGGDSFARKKPDPLPVLKTCQALGALPARTLMIGDSSNDAQAARAAGCPVVLVTYGCNHGEPVRGVDADGFIDSLAALTDASG